MFESLQDRLQGVFDQLNKRGRLSEADVDTALREVRLALLEADVNFKVVKEFIGRVRERAVGAEVTKTITPGQQVIKIVHEELLTTLGESAPLDLGGGSPHIIMLVGLQGHNLQDIDNRDNHFKSAYSEAAIKFNYTFRF